MQVILSQPIPPDDVTSVAKIESYTYSNIFDNLPLPLDDGLYLVSFSLITSHAFWLVNQSQIPSHPIIIKSISFVICY